MELFIRRIAQIISCSNTDTCEIIKTLHRWKSSIEEADIINNSLHKISNMIHEKDDVKTLDELIIDIEQKIGQSQELYEFAKAVEIIYHQEMNSELLDEISDCYEFRNIVTPYIARYAELLGMPDSAKCLEEIIIILEDKHNH